jgi:hypothetical protein
VSSSICDRIGLRNLVIVLVCVRTHFGDSSRYVVLSESDRPATMPAVRAQSLQAAFFRRRSIFGTTHGSGNTTVRSGIVQIPEDTEPHG